MPDNVTTLRCTTFLDLPPERVLEGAQRAHLQSCIVVGVDEEGEFYFASSKADPGAILWLMERARKMLLDDAR